MWDAGLAQWHQWLRYAREHAPTVEEQQNEVVRQMRIKKLAQLADERWASKPSYLDKPTYQTPNNQIGDNSANAITQPTEPAAQNPPVSESNPQSEENPWTKADRSNPGDSWEPSGWSPNSNSQR